MLKFEKWFHLNDHVEIIKENYKTSTRISSNSTKIPSKYLPNTNPEHYHYINMLILLNVLWSLDTNTASYIVFFLLDDSPASEFYMPTFWNTLSHLHRQCKQEEFFLLTLKHWHIKFGPSCLHCL